MFLLVQIVLSKRRWLCANSFHVLVNRQLPNLRIHTSMIDSFQHQIVSVHAKKNPFRLTGRPALADVTYWTLAGGNLVSLSNFVHGHTVWGKERGSVERVLLRFDRVSQQFVRPEEFAKIKAPKSESHIPHSKPRRGPLHISPCMGDGRSGDEPALDERFGPRPSRSLWLTA